MAVAASYVENGLAEFGSARLFAPPLTWSEARSVLHQLVWRGAISVVDGTLSREWLESCGIERAEPARMGVHAWKIADRLGWAKTYDAEYVAVADLLSCRLVTLDARLRRGAQRLGFVVGPDEL